MSKISISWFSKTFCPQSTAKQILDSNPQHTTTAQRKWARKQWSVEKHIAKYVSSPSYAYNRYKTANQKNMLPILTFEEYFENIEKQAELMREQIERSMMWKEELKIYRQEQWIQEKQQRREQRQEQEQQKQAELMREQRERSMMNNEEQKQKHQEKLEQWIQEKQRRLEQKQKHQEKLEQRRLEREQRRLERENITAQVIIGAQRQKEKEKIKREAAIAQAAKKIDRHDDQRQLNHREGQIQRERQLQVRACELQKVRERVRREAWWEQDRIKYGVQDAMPENIIRQLREKHQHEEKMHMIRVVMMNKEIEEQQERKKQQRALELEKAWRELEQQETLQRPASCTRQPQLENIRSRIIDRIKQKAEERELYK
jgi:hypothetical protein